MAYTHEDGTGVTGANAYALAAEVTAYLTDRGRETENAWDAATTAAQQIAIIKATDYVEKRYAGRWRGVIGSATQGLSWPRTSAYDDNGRLLASDALPDRLIEAVSEYAVRALSADFLADPAAPAANTPGMIQRIRQRVEGAVDRDITYQTVPVGSEPPLQAYPAADLLLAGLIQSGSVFGRVGRA